MIDPGRGREPGTQAALWQINNPELSAKRLSLVKEAVPAASRVAILANPDFKPSSSMVAEMRPAARALGVEIHVLEVRGPQELAQAFAAMVATKADAVVVVPDPMFVAQRRRIAELAARSRMPAMYHLRQFVEAGGLAFYGADYALRVRSAGKVVSVPVLGVIGVFSDGHKHLLALEPCGGESFAAWKGCLDDLVARGLRAPLLAIIDGNAGLRRAVE